MKYLKRFEQQRYARKHTGRGPDYEELKDILMEVEDIGLEVSSFTPGTYRIESDRIGVEGPKRGMDAIGIFTSIDKPESSIRIFHFKEIRPNIEHLINYMKSVGYDRFLYSDDLLNGMNHEYTFGILPDDDYEINSTNSITFYKIFQSDSLEIMKNIEKGEK